MSLLPGRETGEFRSNFMKCKISSDYTIWIVYGKGQRDGLQYYSLFIQIVA